VPALAAALGTLRSDSDRRAALRSRNRQTAVDRHTWTAVVDRALALADGLEPQQVEAA
jgi:hypothetical protein